MGDKKDRVTETPKPQKFIVKKTPLQKCLATIKKTEAEMMAEMKAGKTVVRHLTESDIFVTRTGAQAKVERNGNVSLVTNSGRHYYFNLNTCERITRKDMYPYGK